MVTKNVHAVTDDVGVSSFQKSSVAVLLNTALTGAFGAGFWILAARMFDEKDVGTAVAASSLLIVVSFIAQLNLSTSLSRFLPAAGSGQREFVKFTYVTTALLSLAVALIAVAVGELRGSALIDGGDRWLTIVFAVSIPIWTVFSLQDAVLVAVRRSAWVPIENLAVALAKFALLPLFLLWPTSGGILAAWVLPSTVAVGVVSIALRRRILERGEGQIPRRAAYLRYSLIDFPGVLAYLAALRTVPLLVIERQGAADGAFIGLPWTIITVAAFALPAVSRALLVELSHAAADTSRLLRRAVLLVLGVVSPACLVGAALSAPVLRLAGEQYASVGGPVMAWGFIGLVPAALTECGLAALRHQNRVAMSSAIQVLRGGIIVVGVWVALTSDRPGLIGVVFLVANVPAALIAVRLAGVRLRQRPAVAATPAG